MKRTFLIPAFAAALIGATGCSTIVNHNRATGIDVRSDPPGADIYLDGQPTGARTPARIEITGGSGEHALRVEKAGYGTFERTVSKRIDPWVWGNAPFAVFPIVAAVGFGVDAYCGQWYCVEPAMLDARLSSSLPASSDTAAASSTAPKRQKRHTAAAEPQPEPEPEPAMPAETAAAPKRQKRHTAAAEPQPEPEMPAETAAAPKPTEDAKSDEMDALLRQILEND